MRVKLVWLFALALLGAAPPSPPPAPQQFYDLGDVRLHDGSTIRECRLGFRTIGHLNRARSNAVLFPTFFAGTSADIVAWLGSDGPYDPSRYFTIVVDALGDGVSCSPSNSTLQHEAAFPQFGIDDLVDAQRRLLVEHFGLHHVHGIVGMSMGGMQTMEWIVRYPGFMDVAVPIVGSPRLTSYDRLLWQTMDRELAAGDQLAAGWLFELQLRTPAYFNAHTPASAFAQRYPAHGTPPPSPLDIEDTRRQVRAMMGLDVAPGSTLAQAAARVRARVLVVASEHDRVVNPQPALEFARLLHAQTIVLHGDCGHLAAFCQAAVYRPAVEALLEGR